jgi:hypothetical protein
MLHDNQGTIVEHSVVIDSLVSICCSNTKRPELEGFPTTKVTFYSHRLACMLYENQSTLPSVLHDFDSTAVLFSQTRLAFERTIY